MKKSSLILIFTVGFLCFALIAFSSFLILLLFKSERIGDQTVFQLTSLHLSRNEISVGTVNLPEQFLENQESSFLNFRFEDHLFLISRFDEDIYRCSGSCHCNDIRRSLSSSILSRSLIWLLATFTTVSAIHLSKQHFNEECISLFSDSCSTDRISSEVIECSKIEVPQKKKNGDNFIPFHCTGTCTAHFYRTAEGFERIKKNVRIREFAKHRLTKEEIRMNSRCEKNTLEKRFTIQFDQKAQNQFSHSLAVEKFQHVLKVFCWDVGPVYVKKGKESVLWVDESDEDEFWKGEFRNVKKKSYQKQVSMERTECHEDYESIKCVVDR